MPQPVLPPSPLFFPSRAIFAFLAVISDPGPSPSSEQGSPPEGAVVRWAAVLRDHRLALQDRVAFACRFLPDPELWTYVGAQCLRALWVGDVRGLLLTGLSPLPPSSFQKDPSDEAVRERNSAVALRPAATSSTDSRSEQDESLDRVSPELGLELVQSYLDRSGDVQTAALLAAFFQGLGVQDSRLERWIYQWVNS